MIFVVSFLGALFAILVALLVVYTYVMLRLFPKLERGIRNFVEEVGPRAVFERANLDPAEALRQLGVPPAVAAASFTANSGEASVRVLYTCADHGRCAGCPRVLAQFEAIVRHQGAESLDEAEQKCHAQLREKFGGSAPLAESEGQRQHALAERVIDTLVREGIARRVARGAVWACSKEARATFSGWLSAAREGCQRSKNVENVA